MVGSTTLRKEEVIKMIHALLLIWLVTFIATFFILDIASKRLELPNKRNRICFCLRFSLLISTAFAVLLFVFHLLTVLNIFY